MEMKLPSYLNSKNLTLLFTVCFLISLYFNLEQWSDRKDLSVGEEVAKGELQDEQRILATLEKLTGPNFDAAPVRPVQAEMVDLVLAIRSNLPEQMISLNLVSTSKRINDPKGAPLQSLFTPIQRTVGLKTAAVHIEGKYKNLRLLQAYIDRLKRHPVMLTKFTLKKDGFTVDLQLIGK
jgi:hypothetical protein